VPAWKVGQKLGYDPAEEIRLLRKRVGELEGRLADLERQTGHKR